MHHKQHPEGFLKKQKVAYIFAISLVLFCSGYLFLYDRSQSWLISPLIFLPFVWCGFILTILYIIAAGALKIKSSVILVILPIWFFASSYGSMFIGFNIQESYGRAQRRKEMDAEVRACDSNYQSEKNLYNIQNLFTTPIYTKQNKISGFKLNFLLSSSDDQQLRIGANISINGGEVFYSDSVGYSVILKKNNPKQVVISFDHINPHYMGLVSKQTGPLAISENISIFDVTNHRAAVFFVPNQPGNRCQRDLMNKVDWPVYQLPGLTISGYTVEDLVKP